MLEDLRQEIQARGIRGTVEFIFPKNAETLSHLLLEETEKVLRPLAYTAYIDEENRSTHLLRIEEISLELAARAREREWRGWRRDIPCFNLEQRTRYEELYEQVQATLTSEKWNTFDAWSKLQSVDDRTGPYPVFNLLEEYRRIAPNTQSHPYLSRFLELNEISSIYGMGISGLLPAAALWHAANEEGSIISFGVVVPLERRQLRSLEDVEVESYAYAPSSIALSREPLPQGNILLVDDTITGGLFGEPSITLNALQDHLPKRFTSRMIVVAFQGGNLGTDAHLLLRDLLLREPRRIIT